jgi:hypothetical protein
VHITSKKLFIQYGLYQDSGAKCKSKVEATMTKKIFPPKKFHLKMKKAIFVAKLSEMPEKQNSLLAFSANFDSNSLAAVV